MGCHTLCPAHVAPPKSLHDSPPDVSEEKEAKEANEEERRREP